MPGPKQRSNSAAHGFTLVELVLVIFIIAVLGAIALPRFANASRNQRLHVAAERLKADLQLARTRARASSQAVTVTFNRSDESYDLSGIGGEAMTVELDEDPYRVLMGQAKFGAANDEFVTFNAFGIPHASGFVVLKHSSTEKITVNVNTSGEVE